MNQAKMAMMIAASFSDSVPVSDRRNVSPRVGIAPKRKKVRQPPTKFQQRLQAMVKEAAGKNYVIKKARPILDEPHYCDSTKSKSE